jgi:hypothetical protein
MIFVLIILCTLKNPESDFKDTAAVQRRQFIRHGRIIWIMGIVGYHPYQGADIGCVIVSCIKFKRSPAIKEYSITAHTVPRTMAFITVAPENGNYIIGITHVIRVAGDRGQVFACTGAGEIINQQEDGKQE